MALSNHDYIKVTAIVPTFNTSEIDLKKTIDSVVRQTHVNIEILIVDDGSFIPFSNLQKSFSDPRIIWLSYSENKGVAFARNHAVKKSTGDYIGFLDAGDAWIENKLEKQLDVLIRNKSLFIFSSIYICRGGLKNIFYVSKCNDWTKSLLIGNPIAGSCSNVLLKKELFIEAGGFDESGKLPEDRDLWLRLSKITEFSISKDVLSIINIDEDSRSFDIDKKKRHYLNFIKKHGEIISKYKVQGKVDSYYHLSIGNKYLNTNNYLKGVYHCFVSLLHNPRVIRLVSVRIIVAVFCMLTGKEYYRVKMMLKK
jgi:glycosyltransferase involved in cell wall biosynthesis